MEYKKLKDRNSDLEQEVKELNTLNSKLMDEYFDNGGTPPQTPFLP